MRFRNYSARSIEHYSECLLQLSKYYNQSPDLISHNQVMSFLYYLVEERQVSSSRINQMISAYKILTCDVLGRPWEKFLIKRPKRERKLPDVFSTQEIEQMLGGIKNMKHRTMYSLIYSCGLRLQEFINLKITDIDSDRMQIHIRSGKGKKDRYVMLSEKVLLMLRPIGNNTVPRYIFLKDTAEDIQFQKVRYNIPLRRLFDNRESKKTREFIR